MSVEIDVVRFATVVMPRGYLHRPPGGVVTRWAKGLRGLGDTLQVPCLAFVLRHPDHGTLLVDTGLHPRALDGVRHDFGPAMGIFFRSLRPVGGSFDAQLRERGIEPGDVQRVVMTHLHVDHTSAMRLLPGATFTCTRTEWDAAHARGGSTKGYIASHLPPEDRVHLVDFSTAEPHGAFDRTIDLLGDGTVRLVSTPGHTVGHLSLLVRTRSYGEVLLVGDAAYTLGTLDQNVLPLLTENDEASLDTLRQLRAHRAAHPDAPVVPSHDPSAWQQLVA